MTIASAPSAHLAQLRQRAVAIRRKFITVTVATGIAQATIILLAALLAEGLLDWLVTLPWVARAAVLGATLATTAWALRECTLRPLRAKLDEDSAALLIERALPVFNSRYISALQLGREDNSSSPSLVDALLEQTGTLAARQDYRSVVRTGRMWKSLLAAAGVAALVGLAFHWGGPASAPLLRRALLSTEPLPSKTQIEVLTGSARIGVGEEFIIEVRASGVLPPGGRVETTSVGGRKQDLELLPSTEDPSLYTAVVQRPQESFEYVVRLNDATSEAFDVETLTPPAVADLSAVQHYPIYVDVPPQPRQVGDFALLLGSRLEIDIRATSAIADGQLILSGKDGEVPLTVDPSDATRLHATLAIDDQTLTGFSVRLVDSSGVHSVPGALYRIDVQSDQPPSVKIVEPTRREELATPRTQLQIAFEASDDLGVAQATLHYQVGDAAEEQIKFHLPGQPERLVKSRFEWDLGALEPRLAIGVTLNYFIEVWDGNTQAGPGIGESEHYQIRVVSEDEKRADLTNRLNDAMSGLSEVTDTQETLNRELGELIFQKNEE